MIVSRRGDWRAGLGRAVFRRYVVVAPSVLEDRLHALVRLALTPGAGRGFQPGRAIAVLSRRMPRQARNPVARGRGRPKSFPPGGRGRPVCAAHRIIARGPLQVAWWPPADVLDVLNYLCGAGADGWPPVDAVIHLHRSSAEPDLHRCRNKAEGTE